MEQRFITLKQVRGQSYSPTTDLKNVEEGDVISGYKVTDVKEQKCEHTNRAWRMDNNQSVVSKEPPKLQGVCTVCDDVKVVDPTDESIDNYISDKS